jgi:protein gp37
MKATNIQWCHSTVNPVMGCDGCELWHSGQQLASALFRATANSDVGAAERNAIVSDALDRRPLSQIYAGRDCLCEDLQEKLGLSKIGKQAAVDVIRSEAKCYAGLLGTMRAGRKGYAERFEEPKPFPGRMEKAARWTPPEESEVDDKPWLLGLPRLIFVSDMGDALSTGIPFSYLRDEIIANVSSPAGSRHVWLWLTKRPERMAKFGDWLTAKGIEWPDNLVAMTTVTSAKFAHRVDSLRDVPSKFKGLSCEPLFGSVELDLRGIDWVIVGGGSDTLAKPFHVEWALEVQQSCQRTKAAFFLKQLGRNPYYAGKPLQLNDKHGGDWKEWPEQFRIRELPSSFRKFRGLPAETTLLPG